MVKYLLEIQMSGGNNMLLDEQGKQFDLEQLKEYEKIIFFGASTRNKTAITDLAIEDKVLYYVDSNSKKCGSKVDGYEVHKVDEIAEEENVLIISVLVQHVDSVLDRLQEYHVKCLFYTPEIYDIDKVVEQNEKIIKTGNTYKYIHTIPALIFMRFFYEMLEENDDISQHLFIVDWYRQDNKYKVYQFICEKNIQNNNILVLNDFYGFTDPYIDGKNINKTFFSEQMDAIFSKADKILLHSALLDKVGSKLMSDLADEMGEKMRWICFGPTDSNYKEDNPIVKDILKKVKVSYAAAARISGIKQNYNIPLKKFSASYFYIKKDTIKNLIQKDNTDEYINILLGHSAASFGNHMYGLELLEKYRNENIKIYCPLSYNPASAVEGYDKIVIEKGKELFADKFIPILDYMEPNEYYAFLQTIDIAVFPLTKLAAGTNLTYLSTIGKKIYMSKEMCQNVALLDIHAEDMEHIRTQSFDEFTAALDTDETENKILELDDKMFFAWKKILED